MQALLVFGCPQEYVFDDLPEKCEWIYKASEQKNATGFSY